MAAGNIAADHGLSEGEPITGRHEINAAATPQVNPSGDSRFWLSRLAR